MKKIDINELKEIQMQILDYVDKFCQKYSIQYSLCAGTLLGAIRHKGYIPWDDDIDIQLVRNEYERFTALWNQEKHPYVFHNINSDSSVGVPFGKISDPHTIIIEPGLSPIGVNIDVIPIDKVIDEEDFNTRHNKVLDLYVRIWKKRRKWSWKPNVLFWKFYSLFDSAEADLHKINAIAKSRNDERGTMLFEMVGGRTVKRPWSSKAFKDTIDVQFENRTYKVFAGYDEYLTAAYGDYMKLPPEEKQISHHDFEAWWKD